MFLVDCVEFNISMCRDGLGLYFCVFFSLTMLGLRSSLLLLLLLLSLLSSSLAGS